jgi:adenylate kinase family enzyme
MNGLPRVLILGSPGSGKSTLARSLSVRLDVPVIHLDVLWWEPRWVEAGSARFQGRIATHLDQDGWIIDGNYTRHGFDARLDRADTVIWLDLPRWLCLCRVTVRAIQLWGKTRPDMGADCPEKLDLTFLQFVADWNRNNRPKLTALFAELAGKKSLHHVRSTQEASRLLRSVGS